MSILPKKKGECKMLALGAYEKCKRYIESHTSEETTLKKRKVYPCVTISRLAGSGSYEVSSTLINLLQQRTKDAESPWTYFNKELIKKVVEDYNLPKIITSFLPEEKYKHINDAVNDLLGVRPADWTILHKTTETILKISRYGKAIIVGRGSNVITSNYPNAFHIRLVAPIEKRIHHVRDVFKFNREEAVKFIKKEDARRKKYLKTHFFRDPDDATLYHLVLNTGILGYEVTAEIIADALIKKFPENFN